MAYPKFAQTGQRPYRLTGEMPADMLTKALPKPQFEKLRYISGIRTTSPQLILKEGIEWQYQFSMVRQVYSVHLNDLVTQTNNQDMVGLSDKVRLPYISIVPWGNHVGMAWNLYENSLDEQNQDLFLNVILLISLSTINTYYITTTTLPTLYTGYWTITAIYSQ